MSTTHRMVAVAAVTALVGCFDYEPAKQDALDDNIAQDLVDDVQVGLTGGSAADGFTFIDSQESTGPDFFWIDISETGTALDLGDDAGSSVSIPFSFSYYGTGYTSIGVGANGGLYFDGTKLDYPATNPSRARPQTTSPATSRCIGTISTPETAGPSITRSAA